MRIWLKHGEAEKIMTLDGKNRSRARVSLGLGAIIMTCGLTACGGGTGLGPASIQKREDKLRDELKTLTQKDVTLNIQEVKKPELDAQDRKSVV